MKHNVYDFDNTIYKNDATLDFYLFCLRKKPRILLEIPIIFFCFMMYLFRISTKTIFKERFFRFLRCLDSTDELLTEFWKRNHKKMAEFYKIRYNENDIIISASPEFLIRPVCELWGIKNIIASRVDKNTGCYCGENCWGPEKLKRLREEMPEVIIEEFYSDSLTDVELAAVAEKAFIVRKGKIISWSEFKPSLIDKIKSNYISKDFFLFTFCGGMGTLTNFVLSLIVSLKIDATTAYIFGYTISLLVTYSLNAKLIFKNKFSLRSFIKFVLSYLPNFLILFIFVSVFLNFLKWNKVIVYALAGLFGLPVTYILVKIYAFGRRVIE